MRGGHLRTDAGGKPPTWLPPGRLVDDDIDGSLFGRESYFIVNEQEKHS